MMRVAFTSSNGRTINLGFGKTHIFQIWEIDTEQAVRCAPIGAIATDRSREECSFARVNAVAHCDLVCTMAMGDGATAKLVSRGVYPLKTNTEIAISEMVARIQCMLRHNPPPWIKRIMEAS